MKILHIIYDHIRNPWVGGGGAVRALELYKRLADRGHDITIISGHHPGATDHTASGVRFIFLGSDSNYICSTFSFAWKAAAFVRRHEHDFDVIVEDFAPWNPVFTRFLTHRPVILHINHVEGRSILRRWSLAGVPFFLIEKYYPLLFQHVTVLSEATQESVRGLDTVIVPAGINGGLLRDSPVETPGADGGGPILYIGRLHIGNKGLDTLFSAMKHVDTPLLIVGKGPDDARLKNMARSLPHGRVEFSGFVSDEKKMDLLKSCSFLVLPSRFEGWGMVILEAAALGKVSIVSDIPGLRYAVRAGFALSFRTGNAEDLAEKLTYLIKNQHLRLEMGARAREYAKDFTWEKIADEFEKYLLRVIESHR